jgi:hypothetical protein
MASSGMERRLGLVGSDVSKERISDSLCSADGSDTFLRNIGSYNNRTASHPRRRHSSCRYLVVVVRIIVSFRGRCVAVDLLASMRCICIQRDIDWNLQGNGRPKRYANYRSIHHLNASVQCKSQPGFPLIFLSL